MKVLLINTSERTGGAAVACGRLAKALRGAGIEVKTLVRDKQTNDPDVVAVSTSRLGHLRNKLRFYWERMVIFASNGFDRSQLFKVSIANTGTDISRHPLVQEADIIHLHWVNQGFLSLADIEKLTHLGKPIIWTLHDMWPITGICHYAFDCDKYTTECEGCPYLRSHTKDLSTKTFNRKKNYFEKENITFVGCSEWIATVARKSFFNRWMKVVSIPNPIDSAIFNKTDKKDSRVALNLPLDKKLLLFGAVNINDKRKGIDYFLEALSEIKNDNIELIIFGQISDEARKMFPIKIHSLGYISDVEKIRQAYNAADTFVIPSLEDNLPNTIMEAMACGTPCVGFNIGGIPEMIDHKVNGYVATYKDAKELAAGIEWTLNNNGHEELSIAAINKVRSNYTEAIVAEKYLEIYREEVNNTNYLCK